MAANDPITKKDLLDLEARLEAKIDAKMDAKIDGLEKRLVSTLTDVIEEKVRDAQTEILRGFERFQTGLNIRIRKTESDITNINASTTLRLDNLEERIFEVEKKLFTGNR